MSHLIRRAGSPPAPEAAFDSEAWNHCPVMRVAAFRPEGSNHRPECCLRLQYDNAGIYGRFRVRDRYVRCVAEKFQDPVCRDSCVELFVQPSHGTGFINFEFNASGVMLIYHVRDHRRRNENDIRPLTEQEVEGVKTYPTLPARIEPEIADDVCYELGFFLPFTVFAQTHNAPVPAARSVWRGNAYKCGDATSHPHWASWRPVKRVNFHEPDCFGTLEFE